MEYYQSAAVPTRSNRPKDKGHVESGVKVVTQWVIHRLRDQRFHDLDDLNTAIAECLEQINSRTPFRGAQISRQEIFAQDEHDHLTDLPDQAWAPVTWRHAKVHRDWHIQIDSVKYSVPYTLAGRKVDVRISGAEVLIMNDNQIVATHQMPTARHGFVTDPGHAPMNPDIVTGLWSRGYFLRQAAKVGPATVAALTNLLDSKVIEAQGFRSCMNILSLGKGTNRPLLEAACEQLLDPQGRKRAISYTAVKNQLAAVRTQRSQRPSTGTPRSGTRAGAPPTRGQVPTAHLDGPEQFSLERLRTTGVFTSPDHYDNDDDR